MQQELLTERVAQIIIKVMKELNIDYSKAVDLIEKTVNRELLWMQQHPEGE